MFLDVSSLKSFDVQYSERSFWLGRRGYEPRPALQGDLDADIVIVGAGFTGLWTAILLKEEDPGLNVLVLEAQVVGYGATGRNAGFCMTTVGRSLKHLLKSIGQERTRATYLAMVRTLHEIDSFAKMEGIDADIWYSGNLAVSSAPVQDRRVEAEWKASQQLWLGDFELLDEAQVRDRIVAHGLRMGLYEPHCLILDPAALVRGLRDAAVRQGVLVFEQSPVESLESLDGGRICARTPGGTVFAERGLVATNAYAHSIPELSRYIFTIYAYALATAPLDDQQLAAVGWRSRCGVEDRRLVVHGYRLTADRRIIWCGRDAPFKADGPSREFDRDGWIFERLKESFRWTFPQLASLGFDAAWGGPICGTIDCIASVRWLENERLLYALGYAGHGVGPSRLVAKVARDLLLGRSSDLLELPFFSRKPVALPPGRALKRFGLGVAQWVIQKVDDDLQGRQGFAKRWIARLFE
jgi:glycine/D-amino acid oxidase-like deaminating enzyme